MEIRTVDPNKAVAANGSHTPTITMEQQTHIFNTNLQKELLSEFKWDSKIKSQEFSKFLADKKALITIVFGQFDKATKTKIALRTNYAANRQAERLIEFLN